MKSFFLAAFLITLSLSSIAQSDTTNKSLQSLLTYYFNIKNALVKDDAEAAASNAAQLQNAAKSIDVQTLSPLQGKAFAAIKEKLLYNSDHISEVTDIDHQREHFEALSAAMSTLVQSASLSQQPVYIDYCPMKKSYWLSNEKEIQNPYYGKQMPDCGSVNKTILPGKEHTMQMDDKMDMNHAKSMNDTMPMKNMEMNDSDRNMSNMNNMDMNKPMGNMSHSFSLNLPMSRNGSGTGWSPDAAPMYGTMYHSKKWMYMLHYNLFIRYNKQDVSDKGSRGGEMVDAPNWLMFMGQRKVGERGLFRFSTMFSLDALITGQKGYPLLFQSGESAHGVPLVDRQHPHDLFSELSVAYTYAFSKKADVFAYVGYPGEPALGPVAFMHRASTSD
ncbi:MAG: DUF3347 domain-containing protein, partial [Bacteroidota bacterium]|nr:DUF3347 domain-containing protein [Bacteroidota bacterium]